MLRRHFPSSFFFVSLNSICRVGIFRLRFWRGSVSGRCYQLKSAGNWRQSNRSLQNVRIKIFDWRRRRRRRRRRWRRRRRRRQERKRERRVGNVWCRTKVMVLTRPLSRALLSNWLILRMSAVNGRWARFHGCGRAGIGAGFRLRGTGQKTCHHRSIFAFNGGCSACIHCIQNLHWIISMTRLESVWYDRCSSSWLNCTVPSCLFGFDSILAVVVFFYWRFWWMYLNWNLWFIIWNCALSLDARIEQLHCLLPNQKCLQVVFDCRYDDCSFSIRPHVYLLYI